MDSRNFLQNLTSWFLNHGIKVISILIASVVVNRFLKIFIEKIIKRQIKNRIGGDQRKRIETLISIFGGTAKFIIWIIAILMILPEFGINMAPILAGVGVASLAVGMAARDIISDFIAGIFILLEDQYHVGDRVKITGIEGVVEEITLRRTILKDGAGVFHSIPNSQIKVVAKNLKDV
jgi:small conductance mechanosensitive channel